ncbi:type VI secretion system tube protein Hcp [Dyella sp.]|uniref:Hcp family type VI secretion system effector n=1 Tax=Dyella sp. TaxID=1869338 RepID=UPI002ECFD6AE
MSSDFFLKLDGIGGEAKDADHTGEIEIDGWSFAVNDDLGDSGAVERLTGGIGDLPKFRRGAEAAFYGITAGVSVGDLRLIKRVDAASAPLLKAATTQQKIAKAVLTCRKASGEEGLEYLQIQLSDVTVNKWKVGVGNNDVLPVEELVLSYTRIEFTYQPQGRTGTSEGKKLAGWDRKLNSAM